MTSYNTLLHPILSAEIFSGIRLRNHSTDFDYPVILTDKFRVFDKKFHRNQWIFTRGIGVKGRYDTNVKVNLRDPQLLCTGLTNKPLKYFMWKILFF